MSVKENILILLQGLAATVILGILFFQSVLGILVLSPVIPFYRSIRAKELMKEQKWRLNLEFRDGIAALAAALEAGYSAENAYEEAYKDLRQIYQEGALILREFSGIIHQIKMSIPVEKALYDFGERTGIEDIQSFSEVFHTAKRTGGDLIHIIKSTSSIISDKIEVKREINTLITGKRLEANIMKLTPLLILFYFSVSSPDFLTPLYHNLSGVLIMTLFLFSYLGAYLLIDKIVAIEV